MFNIRVRLSEEEVKELDRQRKEIFEKSDIKLSKTAYATMLYRRGLRSKQDRDG